MSEKPYVAVILYEATSDSPAYDPLYREDFVLVHAASEGEAREAVRRRAEAESGSHRNECGELITWRCKHVVDVAQALDEDLARDADLYARHFRDYGSYRRFEPLLSG
ncbi:DUF4288 domain-containing protein [Amycolatopsis sp. FDAARGOS 1241]|uniref:DUF4288 domain-containing protein n=1 Tax=Amycolatopsis sp. FDAARGOS 1241 TaxID=2778070 RepID=UPI00194E55B9|nr:DUF4288 domain-containing protein [Amycolatopsis sp. FDAARGOS 1241]QRP44487.1 DUF4288 domain-containing protein [Amycolatopsis sp. FDAARGOS 1241]